MKIWKFDTYTFDDILMVDDWDATRPPITAPIAGAIGVYDSLSTAANPIAPITVVKKWAISKATSAEIDDERDTILSSVVTADEGLLYAIDRAGSPGYTTPAKCVGFSAGETYQEKGRFLKTFQATFSCRSGIWNAQGNDHSYQSAALSGSGTDTIIPAPQPGSPGHLRSYVTIRILCSIGTLTAVTLTNTTTGCALVWAGSLAVGESVYIDTLAYNAYHSPSLAAAYSELTPSQLPWWWLDPGNNGYSYSITPGTATLVFTYARGLRQL